MYHTDSLFKGHSILVKLRDSGLYSQDLRLTCHLHNNDFIPSLEGKDPKL